MKLDLKKQRFKIISLLFISLSFCILSCDKDDIDYPEPVQSDKYYVQYTISGNGAYGRFSNWTATTPQGIYANNGKQIRGWNEAYGPVDRGFKCEVIIDDYIGGTPTIQIHVSKNEEPFVLKEIVTEDLASYTIDF